MAGRKINFNNKFVEKLINAVNEIGCYGFHFDSIGNGGISLPYRSDNILCDGIDGKFLYFYVKDENITIEIPTSSEVKTDNNPVLLHFIFPNKSVFTLMFNNDVNNKV